MKRFWCMLLIAALCLTTINVSAAEEEKELTIMIYLCGSNLESDGGRASVDLRSILGSQYNTGKYNIIALLGGSKKWRTGYDPDLLTTVELTGKKPVTLKTDPVTNMGDPDTLSAFLEWGYTNYPARDYALIMWDHGGGPNTGVCLDQIYDDTLKLDEITTALQNSPFADRKLKWIGFDACLMCSVEVADSLTPYASYMFASEEITFGSDYNFLFGMENDPDTPATGIRLADSTIALFSDTEDSSTKANPDLTMAVIDLSRIGEVRTNMNDFFTDICDVMSIDDFPDLSRNRDEVRGFGRQDTTFNDPDLADLGGLVTAYAHYSPDKAARLMDSIDAAVVYHVGEAGDDSGLSVYHPYYNKNDIDRNMSTYSFMGGYQDYIAKFSSLLTGKPAESYTDLSTDRGNADRDKRTLFSLKLSEKQVNWFKNAALYVLEKDHNGHWHFVFSTRQAGMDENGMLTASFGGTALYAVNDHDEPLTLSLYYLLMEDGSYHVPAKAVKHDPEGDIVMDVILLCTENGKVLTPEGILTKAEDETLFTQRTGWELADFDELIFSRDSKSETRTEDWLLPYEDWEQNGEILTWTVPADDVQLRLLNDTIDETDLYATFQVTDVQNNVYSSAPAVVKASVSEVTEVRTEYDDANLIMIDEMTIVPGNNGIRVNLKIRNLTEQEALVQMNHVALNRTVAPDDLEAWGIGSGENEGLMPEEEQNVSLLIPADQLTGMDSIREITFDLNILEAADESNIGTVPVIMTLNVDLEGK